MGACARVCVSMFKSTSKKMNPKKSERVYEQERKYEYGHSVDMSLILSLSESLIMNMKSSLNGISIVSTSTYMNINMRIEFQGESE